MEIVFEGDEPDWVAQMEGSRKAVVHFKECVAAFEQMYKKKTSPLPRQPETSPLKREKV